MTNEPNSDKPLEQTLGRLAVRTDGKICMGGLFDGQDVLEPGALYEIVDIMGDIYLRKIGKSSFTEIQEGHPVLSNRQLGNWGCDVSTIIRSHTHYLLTADELIAALERKIDD